LKFGEHTIVLSLIVYTSIAIYSFIYLFIYLFIYDKYTGIIAS